MADLLDFLHAALFEGGLRGQFLAQIKNPQKSDADISKWLASEGYTISATDCERLRQLEQDNEYINGPGAFLPKY
jgi:hypothetical protein